QRGHNQRRVAADEDGVAICGSHLDGVGGNHSARTGAIFNYKVTAKLFGKLLAKETSRAVSPGAWPRRDHDPNGLASRVIVSLGIDLWRQSHQCCSTCGYKKFSHRSLL